MRLTCPNCAAQYEVPDAVIPQDGRDVQCSSCGTTWFQDPAGATPSDDVAAEAAPVIAESEDEQAEPAPEVEAEAEEAPEPEEIEPEEPEIAMAPARRELDPKVAEILRQEAEREAQLRAEEETVGLESQPDLGLDDSETDAEVSEEDTEKPAVAIVPKPVETAPTPDRAEDGPRRDLLPDVEEINSSLRKGDDPSAEIGQYDDDEERQGGSFTRGFAVGIAMVGACALAYLNADRVVETVPQLDPAMTAYVGAVDQARVSFDSMLGALLTTPEI